MTKSCTTGFGCSLVQVGFGQPHVNHQIVLLALLLVLPQQEQTLLLVADVGRLVERFDQQRHAKSLFTRSSRVTHQFIL